MNATGFDRDGLIDLRVLFLVVWRQKRLILIGTGVIATLSVLITLTLPNYYRSSSLLAPAISGNSGGLAALAGQFGGLASLAGVNLGGEDSGQVTLAIEVFNSRSFSLRFIEENNLSSQLLVATAWDSDSGELEYDAELYDVVNHSWRDTDSANKLKNDTHRLLKRYRKLVSIKEDKKTGFITISVDFLSPETAKKWVEQLIVAINDEIRSRDVVEAQKSIDYLSAQLQKTTVAELREVFHSLIEEHMKTKMFAETREEYVFKVVDPAFRPERKAYPRRSVIVILSTMASFVLLICFSLVRAYVQSEEPNE
jgi:uncharacterized protein involved in exopolysaccharide biosynthesis